VGGGGLSERFAFVFQPFQWFQSFQQPFEFTDWNGWNICSYWNNFSFTEARP